MKLVSYCLVVVSVLLLATRWGRPPVIAPIPVADSELSLVWGAEPGQYCERDWKHCTDSEARVLCMTWLLDAQCVTVGAGCSKEIDRLKDDRCLVCGHEEHNCTMMDIANLCYKMQYGTCDNTLWSWYWLTDICQCDHWQAPVWKGTLHKCDANSYPPPPV